MCHPLFLSRSALVVLLALTLVACKPKPPAGGPGMGMPPPEVAVVSVQPQTLPLTFEYTGQLAGSRDIEVRARVTGILQARYFTEGGLVKAGQSLFKIDPSPFNAASAGAEADIAAAEARMAQAQRNAARLKPLIEAKAISQKDYDDAASAEQIAAADLKAAKTKLTEARLNLSYTRVESPISGIAGRALKSEGSLVSGPDVLLTTVTQVDPIYALFGVSDNEHLKLQRDADAGRLVMPKDGKFDVALRLADGTLYSRHGKMNFSDIRINGNTGTSELRAELPNPGGRLRPGEFVRVVLHGAQRINAIMVPQRAVLDGPQGKFVYILDAQSKAEIRPVEVGDWAGEAWVINSGLKAGDKVIVDGVMKIGPGAPVKLADPNAPKGPPGPPPTAKK